MTSTPDLLNHLAAHLGLTALPLDEQGCCALRVGDALVLNFRWLAEDERLVLFAVLGTLPMDGRAELMAEMLRGNRFGLGTAGATLSLDEQSPPHVLLTERFDGRHTMPAAFVEAVEAFAYAARRWAARVDAPPAAPAWVPPALPGAMPSFA